MLLIFPANVIVDPVMAVELVSNGWYADKPIDKVLLPYAKGLEHGVILG